VLSNSPRLVQFSPGPLGSSPFHSPSTARKP
jgi:hypothetical protein